jgi:hypothetical protein
VNVELWASEDWLQGATEWLDARLAEAGLARTGTPEQPHLRPWATVLRIPTTRGPVWLKAAGRDTAFEAPLYELLLRVAPDRVLTPLAIDTQRAWILLPDGGPPLGQRLKGAALMAALERILPEYGRLQRDLAPHAELVATLELACRLGKVARALTWHRAIGAGPDEAEASWIRGPIESMVSLLDDSYLGRA